jgi:hypothetical protein
LKIIGLSSNSRFYPILGVEERPTRILTPSCIPIPSFNPTPIQIAVPAMSAGSITVYFENHLIPLQLTLCLKLPFLPIQLCLQLCSQLRLHPIPLLQLLVLIFGISVKQLALGIICFYSDQIRFSFQLLLPLQRCFQLTLQFQSQLPSQLLPRELLILRIMSTTHTPTTTPTIVPPITPTMAPPDFPTPTITYNNPTVVDRDICS